MTPFSVKYEGVNLTPIKSIKNPSVHICMSKSSNDIVIVFDLRQAYIEKTTNSLMAQYTWALRFPPLPTEIRTSGKILWSDYLYYEIGQDKPCKVGFPNDTLARTLCFNDWFGFTKEDADPTVLQTIHETAP